MGVFTEQVQGLVSESKLKRQRQEEKEKLRIIQEKAERDLYYKIDNIFSCTTFTRKNIFKKFNNKKSIYNFLLENNTKNYLIEKTTKNVDIQYYLDKKYLSITKKIYMPYKELEKEQEQQEKEKQQQEKEKQKQLQDLYWQNKANIILNSSEHLKPKKQKKDKSKLLLIGIIPFAAIYGLWQGILYPKKKKRR